MKKFISMVMAAAMVVSLVPATAFAKGEVTATAKVVDAAELKKGDSAYISWDGAPELQMKVKEVDYQKTNGEDPEMDVTVTIDGAEFKNASGALAAWDLMGLIKIVSDDNANFVGADSRGAYTSGSVEAAGTDYTVKIDADDVDDDEFTFTIVGELAKDDIISVDLESTLDKVSAGKKATVSVDSKMVTADDLVYATVLDKGIKASVKKTVDVAEDEKTELDGKGLKLESVVGDFEKDQEITLKISKGFEFVKNAGITVDGQEATVKRTDDNELTVTVNANADDEIVIRGIEIEAVSAKAGAVATITVKSSNWDSASVEVAKVVDYKVVLSVDEDEDVPVIYSGVNVDNDGITDDSDHVSLEVTAEETFPGAWSMRKGFSFELPEGVYVTDVDVTDTEGLFVTEKKGTPDEQNEAQVEQAFFDAYQKGDHLNFEFEKRVFDDVNNDLNDDCAKMVFTLELVADPTFEGDVVLKLTGDLVDTQEVTIAKFVKPYTVKAEQNDLKIDYRYTEIPTAITITEAEAGLWAKGSSKNEPAAEFTFKIDRGDMINFEDDATFEVDKDSEMEIDDFTNKKEGTIGFTVDEESDEAATITIKDMSLFMNRNIPAGPYDLTISTSMATNYEKQILFAPDCAENTDEVCKCNFAKDDSTECATKDHECFIGDVCDYSDVVKEAFINVITAGREVDDASFTTKVVVPVGESYIISGENQITLDVPAYINAAGYTMLPVRAVAVALGINTNNVLWDQATKTVTILYGQRIITMVAGQKVVYVNGSAIPASASVEIVKGRTFLPMRDLATALGVTDITWDAATKTATLNGNQK